MAASQCYLMASKALWKENFWIRFLFNNYLDVGS